MRIIFGILKWILAIAAAGGTIALFTWIAIMFFRKDNRNDSARNGD